MTLALLPTGYQSSLDTVRVINRRPTMLPKQLKHRRLPIQGRLLDSRNSSSSSKKVLPKKKKRSVVLGKLRRSYARRGSGTAALLSSADGDAAAKRQEVLHVTLAGAKRRYVELDSGMFSDDDASIDSESSSTMSLPTSHRRTKEVQFAAHCEQVEIPHFCEYSTEQKEAMWNGRKQIRSLARKNTIEYQYDGWNLEDAAEEEEFVEIAGVLMHPVHASQTDE